MAREIYASIGMKPVVIRKEIEAFVGDRLLEAAWREALWLVKDGICTVEELDDIMRYRLRPALGADGHVPGLSRRRRRGRHAPLHGAVRSVPEMAVDQADGRAGVQRRTGRHDRRRSRTTQAHGLSIRELERIRDDNLVAIMEALSKQNKGKGWGAGALHNDYTKRLAKLASNKPKASKAAEKAKAEKPVKKAEDAKEKEGLRPWISASPKNSG